MWHSYLRKEGVKIIVTSSADAAWVLCTYAKLAFIVLLVFRLFAVPWQLIYLFRDLRLAALVSLTKIPVRNMHLMKMVHAYWQFVAFSIQYIYLQKQRWCRMSDISEFRNFEYQKNERWVIRYFIGIYFFFIFKQNFWTQTIRWFIKLEIYEILSLLNFKIWKIMEFLKLKVFRIFQIGTFCDYSN